MLSLVAPSDYWIIPLDGAYAVRSTARIEIEGIPTRGDALAHIADLEHADRVEAEQEAAALADFEAFEMMEAA